MLCFSPISDRPLCGFLRRVAAPVARAGIVDELFFASDLPDSLLLQRVIEDDLGFAFRLPDDLILSFRVTDDLSFLSRLVDDVKLP